MAPACAVCRWLVAKGASKGWAPRDYLQLEATGAARSADAAAESVAAEQRKIVVRRGAAGFGLKVSASAHVVGFTSEDCAACKAGMPLHCRITVRATHVA